MNIEQAKANVGKRVLCFNEHLKDKDLWLMPIRQIDGYHTLSVQDSMGQSYGVLPSEIDFLPDHDLVVDMSPLHRELRKEIAFLLIQNGHVVDKGFKDTVDNVIDAIGGQI